MLHSRRLFVGASAAFLVACAAAPAPVAPEIRSALAPTGTLRIGVHPGSSTSPVPGPGQQEMRRLAAT